MGLPPPYRRKEASWTVSERFVLVQYHRERCALQAAAKKYGGNPSSESGGGDGGGTKKGEGKGTKGKKKKEGQDAGEGEQ